MSDNIEIPGWLYKILPLGSILVALVVSFVVVRETGEVHERRITQLELRIKELEDKREKDLEGIRDALGAVQLNLARVCDKLKANCR